LLLPKLAAYKVLPSKDNGWQPPLSTRDSRDNAHFVSGFDGSRGILKEPDIFVVDENIHETPDIIFVITDAFFEAGIFFLEVLNDIADGLAFNFDDFLVVGELT
jgi:hypothetical protein